MSGTTKGAERTSAALRHLSAGLRSAAQELRHLADRADVVADAVDSGQPLVAVMAAETRPLIITRMTQLVDEMVDLGAEVRRAEAAQLQAEGLTQGKVAKVFGVTRQRVSVLLGPSAPPGARARKRPPAG